MDLPYIRVYTQAFDVKRHADWRLRTGGAAYGLGEMLKSITVVRTLGS